MRKWLETAGWDICKRAASALGVLSSSLSLCSMANRVGSARAFNHFVAAGRADKEIGFELGISVQTAQKHVANILHKMGTASRTEASVRAVREGLLD